MPSEHEPLLAAIHGGKRTMLGIASTKFQETRLDLWVSNSKASIIPGLLSLSSYFYEGVPVCPQARKEISDDGMPKTETYDRIREDETEKSEGQGEAPVYSLPFSTGANSER